MTFVRVQPEQPATLHLGEIAVVQLSAGARVVGSAGSALALTEQTQKQESTTYFYRAVGVGAQTLIVTPRDPGPDGCVSCVTTHYFVNVVK
jgi:hypothetical protein